MVNQMTDPTTLARGTVANQSLAEHFPGAEGANRDEMREKMGEMINLQIPMETLPSPPYYHDPGRENEVSSVEGKDELCDGFEPSSTMPLIQSDRSWMMHGRTQTADTLV